MAAWTRVSTGPCGDQRMLAQLLHYLRVDTQRADARTITGSAPPFSDRAENYLVLDAVTTMRNLELLEPIFSIKRKTTTVRR